MSDWDGPRAFDPAPRKEPPRDAARRGRRRPPGGPWLWIVLMIVLFWLALRGCTGLEEEVEGTTSIDAEEESSGTDWEGPRAE